MTIFILLLVMLFAACSEVGSLNSVENLTADAPIQISAVTRQNTKGVIVDDPIDMGTIGLYCAMTGRDSWTSGVEFSKLYNQRYYINKDGDCVIDGDAEPWGYESMDDKYTFFAYSPYYANTKGVTPRLDAGELVLDYTVPISSQDQPDLMYALPRKDISPQVAGCVPLTFYHTLSCVGFDVLSVPDRKITAIEISGVVSTGTLRWDYELGRPKWKLEDPSDSSDFNYDSFIVEIEDYKLDNKNSAQLNTDRGYLMMLPQTLAGGAKVVVTLEGGETKSLMIPANSVWEAGEKYQYVIRLNDDECDFLFTTTQLSNCYIINPTIGESTVIQIPIEDRINEFWKNYRKNGSNKIKAKSKTEEFSVSMVWEDFDESLSFGYTVLDDIDKKMAVKLTFAAKYQQGNVIFAVEDANDSILWSWHLWFTSYNPDAIAEANRANITAKTMEYSFGNLTGAVHRYTDAADSIAVWSGIYKDKFIMDRNIGERNSASESYGAGSVYYQFGRKDPFPGDSATFGTEPNNIRIRSTSGFSFVESVEFSRDIVFSSTSSSANWSDEPDARDTVYLWYDKNVLVDEYFEGKSIFDPSPLGWRIPVADTWSNFTTGSSGISPSKMRYSYCGCRDPNNGTALSQGTTAGYVWSANQVDGQTGCCFSYSSTQDPALNKVAVTHCLPIRAVEE